MPIGDGSDAVAAGMAVVLGTADRRQGAAEITKTRDYAANGPAYWKPGVTLPASKLSGLGVADLAEPGKIPVYNAAAQLTTADPSAGGHAASKQYVDGAVNGRLVRAGDTMTGPLTIASGQNLFLPGATPAVSGYTIAYLDGGTGRVSKGASSIRYKNPLPDPDPLALGDLFPILREFTMKDGGDWAHLGHFAEDLAARADLARFVVYEREPIYRDILTDVWADIVEDIVQDVYDEAGLEVIGQEVIGTRVVGREIVGQEVTGQEVIGSQLVLDADGNPIPESIDFIGLLLAQVAQLNARDKQRELELEQLAARITELEAAK